MILCRCQINCVGGITWTKHAHAQSIFFLAVNARWERDKGLVPVVRACVEFYWNLGKIVFFGIF